MRTFGGRWPGSRRLLNSRDRTSSMLVPHRFHRIGVNSMGDFDLDYVAIHSKAWEATMPELKEMYELGLRAVKDWDRLREWYTSLSLNMPAGTKCARCSAQPHYQPSRHL